MSSLSPDQKLLTLTQYKELASSVGVARYGSKQDLVARINGVAGGNTKLMTLIDKAKKSMVLKKEKKEKQAKKNNNTNGKAPAAPDAAICEDQDDLDFDKLVEHLTDRMQDKLVGHRDLVNMLLKAFDEDATTTQIHKLSDKKAIEALAILMTHEEASDDEEEEE